MGQRARAASVRGQLHGKDPHACARQSAASSGFSLMRAAMACTVAWESFRAAVSLQSAMGSRLSFAVVLICALSLPIYTRKELTGFPV